MRAQIFIAGRGMNAAVYFLADLTCLGANACSFSCVFCERLSISTNPRLTSIAREGNLIE